MHYIYKITNSVNQKVYVGLSKNPTGRWKCHCDTARLIDDHRISEDRTQRIHRSIAKYGVDNFTFEVIEEIDTESRKIAGEREKYWIKEFKSYEDPSLGYNSTPGGDGGPTFKGRHHADETKKHMSDIQNNRSPEWAKNFKYAQQHRSEEWCKHISESHKGHIVSDNTKEHLRNVWIRRKARGPVSQETRRKLSEANKGKHVSDEFRQSTSKRRTEQEMKKHLERAQLVIDDKKTMKEVASSLNVVYRSIKRSLHRLKKLGITRVMPAGEWAWTTNEFVQNRISENVDQIDSRNCSINSRQCPPP